LKDELKVNEKREIKKRGGGGGRRFNLLIIRFLYKIGFPRSFVPCIPTGMLYRPSVAVF